MILPSPRNHTRDHRPSFIRRVSESLLCAATRSAPTWRNFNKHVIYWAGRILTRRPGISRQRLASIGQGAHLLVDLDDPDGLRVYLSAEYEPEVAAFAKAILRTGDAVLDVGANIGAHAILFAELVGEKGHIYAFEPSEYAARQLRASIALNMCGDRLTLYNLALSDCVGTATLRVSAGSGNTSSLIDLPWLSEAPQVRVQTVTLDSLVDDLHPPRLLKLDVEGAELLVLAGGKDRFFVEMPPDYLIVEFWSYQASSRLLQAISGLGYLPIPLGSQLPASRSGAPDFSDALLSQEGFSFNNLFFQHTKLASQEGS